MSLLCRGSTWGQFTFEKHLVKRENIQICLLRIMAKAVLPELLLSCISACLPAS